jgi:archaemetzincin
MRVGKAFGAEPGSPRAYLAVTMGDLYSNESRYVFGVAANGANCGVFSYRRFTSALVEDPPNRNRLKERALKQALSSVGLLFGLPRCTDPTCARAYPNSLAEFDSKQLKLCSQCKEGFVKRFGRKSE